MLGYSLVSLKISDRNYANVYFSENYLGERGGKEGDGFYGTPEEQQCLREFDGGHFLFVFTIKMSQRSQFAVRNYSWHIKCVIRIYRWDKLHDIMRQYKKG